MPFQFDGNEIVEREKKATTQAINLFIYTITSINGLDFEESRTNIYFLLACPLMHFYLN